MNRIIVIQFITLDGVVEDPDGSAATPGGGWAFPVRPRGSGRGQVQAGRQLDTGALLLGRGTWEVFAKRWPSRSGEFATRMNTAGNGWPPGP